MNGGPYEVQQTRWDRIIRRAGGSIGPGSRVRESISELFPVLDVENVPGELLVLAGTRLAWQSTERPASVGNTSASQLQNPTNSGAIVTISRIDLFADVTTILSMEITEVEIGTPAPGLFRDGRLGIARETTAKVGSVDGVSTGGGFRVRLPAGAIRSFEDVNALATIGPGQQLQVGTGNTQIRLTVNYFWREREALPSELQF